jgi:hypothetical protein
MAQADQVVQNDNFPTVRADINNNLAALFTNSSGGTAPTVTVAYQDWIDTSGADPIWKKRNAANNAWITVATIKSSTVELAADNVLPPQSGQSGNYLTTNGTVASWAAITTGINDIEFFASSGSWTCPAGVEKVFITVIGGGAGGSGNTPIGGSGSNGGSGGMGAGLVTVSPGSTYTITIGSGGAGTNTESAAGGSGGSSSFGSNITATGGSSGATNGTCTSADANIYKGNRRTNGIFLYGSSGTVPRGAGTTAIVWNQNSVYFPGSGGSGELSTSSNNATGGVSGAVILWY